MRRALLTSGALLVTACLLSAAKTNLPVDDLSLIHI